jgi:uncharacterized protein YkwD
MRVLSWFGGFLVIAATVFTAVAVTLAHHGAAAPRTVSALHQTAALDVCCAVDPDVAAPHKPYHAPPPPTPPPAAAAPVVAAAPAPPALIVNSTQQALINQDRARNGLAPLTWSSCLYSVARAQAAHLATPGVAFQHYGGAQQDLGCRLGYQAGENIGWYSLGPNDSWMNAKFVASPEHYANIMGPYHYVATAWVVAPNGYGYIAVEFG